MLTTQSNPDRLKRLAINEEQRNIKPGNCNKFLHVTIDPEFLKESYGAQVLPKLTELGCKYEIKPQPCASTVTFYRTIPTKLIGDGAMTEKTANEPFVVHLLDGGSFVAYVRNHQLLAVVRSLKELFPGRRLSLLVFGLVSYCRVHRGCVGRRETEHALTEVQLYEDVSHQLLETDEQVANFVAQLARSIAERPYKQQQMDKYSSDQLYLGNEKKGCVRVEGTAGLQQLYQAQLIKIPSVTLEVAEAIMSVYPTLYDLLQAYRNADQDAPNLLANISIRRAGGPVTTSNRKIGPELSKKIYLLYNSTNGKQEL
ncbi:crossover junction endonuclease EME1 [Anopheles ziemanni]|uniref:crossover junction endonuclease EME1 n=1 Tax=Anopheles coustani TaxID=139045 RepID=UPI002658298A|nr:crossover junction endonuclease EME1 [Anopheles coustani]XP_058172945.1 crossover junction endonuclease EME1 [Anopheles ziemanni]